MGEESEVIVMPKEEKNTCRSDLAPKRKPKQPNVPPPPNLAAVSTKGSVGEAMTNINPPLAAPIAQPIPWRRIGQQQEPSASSAPPPAVPLAPLVCKSAPRKRQASDSDDHFYEPKSESADSSSLPPQSVRSDSSSKPRETKKKKDKGAKEKCKVSRGRDEEPKKKRASLKEEFPESADPAEHSDHGEETKRRRVVKSPSNPRRSPIIRRTRRAPLTQPPKKARRSSGDDEQKDSRARSRRPKSSSEDAPLVEAPHKRQRKEGEEAKAPPAAPELPPPPPPPMPQFVQPPPPIPVAGNAYTLQVLLNPPDYPDKWTYELGWGRHCFDNALNKGSGPSHDGKWWCFVCKVSHGWHYYDERPVTATTN